MNFTAFDVQVIVAMTIALTLMSFTFPALGLAETDLDDIPEYDIEADRFDFAGDFPDRPDTPSSGELEWRGEGEPNDNSRWLEGDADSGVQIDAELTELSNDTVVQVGLHDWSEGTIDESETVHLTRVGAWTDLESFGYEVRFEVLEEDFDADDPTFTVGWEVRDEPDTGWLERIPIAGTVVSGGAEIAGMVGWIGSILIWGVGMVFQTAVNLVNMLYGAMSFMIGMMTWLITGYTSAVAGANSWTGVFVAIPLIILLLELAKVVMIGLSLLPTT